MKLAVSFTGQDLKRNRYVICVIKWIIGISRTSIDRPMLLTIPDGLGHCLAQSKIGMTNFTGAPS